MVVVDELYAQGELAGFRVLVVDDDDDGRDMLVELFKPLAIDVLDAATGGDGLAVFERERPDLVISDINMPDVDGYALIEAIRRLPIDQGRLTPAIAVTAGAESERSALMRGFHCWFSKPVDVLRLVDAIRAFARARARAPIDAPASARISVTRSGADVVIASVGDTRVEDIRMMTPALRAHIEDGARRVVIDLRRSTGFELAAPYVAQRELWELRRAIERVHVVGGPLRAQLVTRAALALLGVEYTVEHRLPDQELSS